MAVSDTDKCVIYNLGDLPPGVGGGKASGLAELVRAGLAVPPGFVIVNPGSVSDDELRDAYRNLGEGSVAVRSSGDLEDGESASFAGQYETVLNVTGFEELTEAVARCLAAAGAGRVGQYRDSLAVEGESAMNIVVQRMVDASAAGVIFTADPVTGSREEMVLEAVTGSGEALVDGSALSSRYLVDRKSLAIKDRTGAAVITDGLAKELSRQALQMDLLTGRHQDMEWAVGIDGVIYWLQMRPITSLEGPGIDELDYAPNSDGQFFTKANIGEMMPGAVTPLTMNIFGDAVDFCIRYFYRSAGALVGRNRRERFVVNFSGHLFLNLDLLFVMAGRVYGSTKESIQQNLLGRTIDESPRVKTYPLPVRIFNLFRLALYLMKKNPFTRKLERAGRNFSIDLESGDPIELYRRIDGGAPMIDWAYTWHLCPSTYSGIMNNVLYRILLKGGFPEGEFDSTLAVLLSNVEGVESADVIRRLEEIAAVLKEDPAAAEGFSVMAAAEAVDWLRGPESGRTGGLFRDFLERHGHRCIREAEFRENDWGEDPSSIVETLQSLVSAPVRESAPETDDPAEAVLKKYPAVNERAFRWVLEQARNGVWSREYTKSIVIKIQDRVKRAYRRLAGLMTEQGLLPDEDLIYFFTHREIGDYLKNPKPETVRWIQKRRRLLPEQSALKFPDVFQGKPVPLEAGSMDGESGDSVKGFPVSAGIARGRVRLVSSPDDAKRLEPGEIMVAAFTDIGWTPYYGIIAGLVTEVGSSLSHGAVVAREYRLPMVTGIPDAMAVLRDGDEIEINGGSGTVSIVTRAG